MTKVITITGIYYEENSDVHRVEYIDCDGKQNLRVFKFEQKDNIIERLKELNSDISFK